MSRAANLHPVPDDDGARLPRHLLAACPGWGYSTGDDGLTRGVYRCDRDRVWHRVAPLPEVTHRLVDRDGDGGRIGIRYRLRGTDGTTAVVGRKELADGVWAGKLDLPLPPGKSAVEACAAAIIDLAYGDVVPEEAVPAWVAGELRIPPIEGPLKGYTECAEDEDRARSAWGEIAQIMRKSPKMILLVGAVVGGLYSRPLRRQITVWEMVGEGRQGKSTTTMLGAACLGWAGDPEVLDGILRPLSSTPQGLLQEMRTLGVLPTVYDEAGAIASRSVPQREELLYTIFTGSKKSMGVRPGETTYRSPGYHSNVIVSGNTSLAAGVETEGIHSKVVTVRTPITMPAPGLVGEEAEADAARDADRLRALAPLAYGWPLAWLRARGMDTDRVRSLVAQVEADLPLPGAGVARTVGKQMALAVAGAVLLSEVIGHQVADVAMACARELLTERMQELEEAGLTPGDRLMKAALEALSTRPRCFPEFDEYKAYVMQTPYGGDVPMLPPVIDGFMLSDTEVCFFPKRLKAVAADAGITDVEPGLKKMRDREQLTVRGARGLRSQVRVRPKPARATDVYILRVPADDEEAEQGGTPGAVEGVPAGAETAGYPVGTPWVPAWVPPSEEVGGYPENRPLTSENVPQPRLGYPGYPPTSEIFMGDAGTRGVPTEQNETEQGGTPEPEPTIEPVSETPEQSDPHASGETVLSLAATTEALTTHTGRTVAVEGAYAGMSAFLERVVDLMPDGGTVAVSTEVAELLGMGTSIWLAPDPKAPKKGKKKAPPEPACIADAAEQGWAPGSRGILGSTTWTRSGVRTSVTVVVPAWTEATVDALEIGGRQLLADDTDPVTAAYRLGRFRELTGTSWVMTAGTSALNLTVGAMFARRHPVRIDLKSSPPITETPRVRPLGWIAEDDGGLYSLPEWARAYGMYVHAYDARAAYLAAMARAELNRSALRHTGPGTPIDPLTPGYWLIPEPEGGYRLPCGLPALMQSGQDGYVWVSTPEAAFLIEDLDVLDYGDAVDSWSVPDHTKTTKKGMKKRVRDGGRLLKPAAEAIRDALLAIPEHTSDPDEKAVRTVTKAMFHEVVGQLRTPSGLVTRSDWRDQIIGTANVTILRRVHQAWQDTGAVPVRLNTDAVYYATEVADPEAFRPTAFPVDPEWAEGTGQFTLGTFKTDLSGPAADYMKGEL